MQTILFESLIILALLLVNGIFAMSELAVVTSRRAVLDRAARGGSAGARRAVQLVDEPTRFLSTVQIGITLVGVLAGAFGGATIAEQLAARLEVIPPLAPFSEGIAIAIVVASIAFCSLVVGELVPKRIAMQAPERIASVVAGPMQALARLASPLVSLLTLTTTTVLRLLGVPEAKGTRVTEEEIRAMIAEGRQSGAVHVVEHAMLEGVFRLGDRFVRDVMLPRTDVDWVGISEGLTGLRERMARPRANAVLVCRDSIDEVVGLVPLPRVLADSLAGLEVDLATVAEQPLFVPGSMSLLHLLERFKASRQRMAVVLDEYGGVEGVVELDDLVAEIVGEVPDGESGPAIPDMTERPDGSWLIEGSVEVDQVFLRFALPAPPSRERAGYRTLAGFVLSHLGRIPRPADHFTWKGHRFEVVDMDGRRVDKILVVPPPGQPR
jgi:putative hemolysin